MKRFNDHMARHVAAGSASRDIPIAWSQTPPRATDRKPVMWLTRQRGGLHVCHDPLPDSRGRVPGTRHGHRSTILEGSSTKDHVPTPEEIAVIDRILDGYAIAMRRDEQLSASGYSRDHPPAWSLCVQKAALLAFGRERIVQGLGDTSIRSRIQDFGVVIEYMGTPDGSAYAEDIETGEPYLETAEGSMEQIRQGDVEGMTLEEAVIDPELFRDPDLARLRYLRVRSIEPKQPDFWNPDAEPTGIGIVFENSLVLLDEPPAGIVPDWLPEPMEGVYRMEGWHPDGPRAEPDAIERRIEDNEALMAEATRAGVRVVEEIRRILDVSGRDMEVDMDTERNDGTIEVRTSVTGGRPVVQITRGRHYWETHENIGLSASMPTGPALETHARRLAERSILPLVRLLERDRQLIEHGIGIYDDSKRWEKDDPRLENPYPAWAHSIDPIVLAVLKARGHAPEEIVRESFRSTYARMRRQNLQTFDKPETRFPASLHRVQVTMSVISLAPGITYRPAKNRISFDSPLPQATVVAMQGRHLSRLIDIDGTLIPDVRIKRITPYEVQLDEVASVTVSPVPVELGRSWLLAGGDGTTDLP